MYKINVTFPKYELNKDNSNRYMEEWGKDGRVSATERQLRRAEHGRNSLTHGKAHKLVIQYQMISPKHTYK